MAKSQTSLLLISADDGLSASVRHALSEIRGVKVKAENSSVARLNGSAVKMAADNDIVIFATDPSNAEDLTAIEALSKQRRDNSVFLALTDKDLPLSRARALSDAGVDDVLPYPMSDEDLAREVSRWLDKFIAKSGGGGDHNGTVIAVVQARGGIGSTTVAVNLADQLQGHKGRFRKGGGHTVALVDLDLQFGAVGDFLDIAPQEGLMQLATAGIVPDRGWTEQSLSQTDEGLDVLTAPTSFVPLDAIRNDQIKALIVSLQRTHDYVVVDLPRALVGWVEPVIALADQMIVVTDSTVPSIRAAKRLIDFFVGDNPGLKVEVVINHEKKPLIQAHHHKEAAKVLERSFNHWLPDDPRAARAAVDYGKPLSQVAAGSGLAKAIAQLAKDTAKAFPVAERAEH